MSMRTATLSAWFACICSLNALAGQIDPNTLVGTWAYHHIRHEMVITYKPDGTYERRSSTSADGGAIHTDKGTWKIVGNNLIETSSKKGAAPVSSVIEFEGKNRFQLDGFMTFFKE